MGVDIETWRSRIGSFKGGQNSIELTVRCAGSDSFCLLFVILSRLTILALLSIGCVEANPGPTFECGLCDPKPQFGTIDESLLHQKCHMNDRNFRFTCPSCSLQFMSFNALNLHVRYFHNIIRNIPQTEATPLTCIVPDCQLLFPSSKLLCQHLKKDHQEKGINTQCPFKEKCKSEHYFHKSSFAVHLAQKHKGWNVSEATQTSGPKRTSASGFDVDNSEIQGFVDDVEMESSDDAAPPDILEDDGNVLPQADFYQEKMNQWKQEFHRNLAMLYLRLEAVHLIPISTVQVIADSIAELTATNLSIMKETISQEFEELEVAPDVKERVLMKILSADCMFAAHHKDSAGPTFSTNALRKAYYRSHFKYVKPTEINLSKDPNNPRRIYYIKIMKTLELFLTDPEIEAEVEKSFTRQSTEGFLEDYKDGSLHNKRTAENGEKCIDLLIFQDEFSPTKDLSSVANIYKILGMYYTIGNLRPHLRSKLACKRLVMLIPDFKTIFSDFKVGCFKKVFIELKKLETTGINFKGEQVKLKLRFVLGDNKGQHEIGGFIQSFSSEYFCRYCPMTKSEIHAEPWKVAALRTAKSYEEASQLVPAGRVTYMGVSRPEFHCPFNKLEDFHVCDPSLPACVGHDVHEGVLNYDLSPIIKYFVEEKKWFSYEQLNRKIRTFKYHGHDSGNKPAPVKFDKNKKKKDGKKQETRLGGHAVQNWTLLRLLPFILDEDFIKDQDDEYWRLYVSLKEIVEIVCAPSITLTELGRLKVMTEDYLLRRKELLGDGKPKHHYFAHYPDLIEIFGPIIHLWTLGFEQVHQYFKNAAKAGKNFIDLGLTLSRKYCMYLAYISAGSVFATGVKVLDPGGVSVGMQKTLNQDQHFDSALESRNIGDQALIMKKISVDDIQFKEGQWLLLGNHSDLEIVVAKITCIVLDASSVFLMLQKHLATYVANVGIYTVKAEICGLSCVPTTEIVYPTAHSMYEWGEHEMCFSLKHTLAHNEPL